MNNLYLLVLLMGVVTFIPRIIPILWFGDLKLNKFFEGFFYYLPYTMLSALIFPGVFSASGDFKHSIIGAITAIILSFINLNSTFVVFGTVGVVYLSQILF